MSSFWLRDMKELFNLGNYLAGLSVMNKLLYECKNEARSWNYFKQREQYNFDISRHSKCLKSTLYKRVVICSVEMCLNGISV